MSRKARGQTTSDDLPGGPGATTTAFVPTQDGYLRTNTLWSDDLTYNGDATETEVWMGFIFDLSSLYTTDSERGLPLEPPIINYLELSMARVTETANTTGRAYVLFVPDFDPVDTYGIYGAGALGPSRQEEWVIGYSETALTASDTTVTLGIGGDDNVVTTMPTQRYDGTTLVNPNDTGNLLVNFGRFQSYTRNSQWSGQIALSVYLTVTGNDIQFWSSRGSGTGPGLNVTYHPFHSGQLGLDPKRRARIRHDPKSGFPGYSDEFIDDGYWEGMKVLPESWDPEDRTGQDFFPPSTEGVVDDEVP